MSFTWHLSKDVFYICPISHIGCYSVCTESMECYREENELRVYHSFEFGWLVHQNDVYTCDRTAVNWKHRTCCMRPFLVNVNVLGEAILPTDVKQNRKRKCQWSVLPITEHLCLTDAIS